MSPSGTIGQIVKIRHHQICQALPLNPSFLSCFPPSSRIFGDFSLIQGKKTGVLFQEHPDYDHLMINQDKCPGKFEAKSNFDGASFLICLFFDQPLFYEILKVGLWKYPTKF
jgi:hypothetical protein